MPELPQIAVIACGGFLKTKRLMEITIQEYLKAKKIVYRYEKQNKLIPKKCFISGDKKSILDGEKYFAVSFSNPEMNIVSSIEEAVFGKGIAWNEEPYRCFSNLEKANEYILNNGFSYKNEIEP